MTEIRVGTVLADRYKLVRFMAKGGGGEVYEATDGKYPGRRLAIKFLFDYFCSDSKACARFEREVEAVENLNSNYIVPVRAKGRTSGDKSEQRLWIAFEFLVGESLDLRVKRDGTLGFDEVAWIVRDLLLGLEVAHRWGVVHRDIKPGNLFLEACRRVRILDFGIAKFIRDESESMALTSASASIGTQKYMSPEQRISAKNVDERTDIFSAGLVAYELLTGAVPHRESGMVDVPSLTDFTRVVWPIELEAWIRRMVALRREDRFADAAEAYGHWDFVCAAMKGRQPRRFTASMAPKDSARGRIETVTAILSSIRPR